MFLKQIHLKNFRCFDDLEISFEKDEKKIRQRTLLLGENGTGKSNVLKAIGLVTAGSDALGEIMGKPEDWIRYGEEECVIKAVLVTRKGEERHISLEWKRGDTLRHIFSRSATSLEEIDRAIGHTDRKYFVLGYGSARKLSSDSRFSKSRPEIFEMSRSQNVASLFHREASLHPLEAWAMDLDYRREDGLSIIKDSLSKFLPGISFDRIDKEKRQLLLKTEDGLIPLDFLSDGYQNMAAWLGDLLYRVTNTFSDYKSPLKTRGLLLIDEIDLHLHPVWQRQLIDFSQKHLPNFQLIATTHSPFTAQQAAAGELHVLNRRKSKVDIQQFTGNPSHLLIHQIVMSDIFGLETDESAMMEKAKKEFRRLKQIKDKSPGQEKKLNQLSEQIETMPETSYSNSFLSVSDKKLMKETRDLLKK